MRVAHPVQHAAQRAIRPPVVMYQAADKTRQQAAPPRARAIERQPRRAQHVQPLRPTADPEPRLVEMLLPRRARDQVAHPRGESPPASRRKSHPQQILQHFRQPLLGQAMRVLQRDRRGGDPRTVLHRRVHSLRERGPRDLAAGPALAGLGTVLGQFQGPRFRPVQHLPTDRLAQRVGGRQRRAAAVAARWPVPLDPVRRGRLA